MGLAERRRSGPWDGIERAGEKHGAAQLTTPPIFGV